MVALAVSYANPIQEHLAYVGPLYAGGSIGRNPLPIGAALINAPPGGYPQLDLARLKRNAEVVALVPNIAPIAIAARRYFMAISERAWAADKLIDLAIAIEALTDKSALKPQTRRLVQLLTGGVLSDQKIRNDFRLVKEARNDIVHKGNIAPNADSLAGMARVYVDLAIHAAPRSGPGRGTNWTSRRLAPRCARGTVRSLSSSSDDSWGERFGDISITAIADARRPLYATTRLRRGACGRTVVRCAAGTPHSRRCVYPTPATDERGD
jgi:hypothetical protein